MQRPLVHRGIVDNELSWGEMRDDKSRYGLALGTLSLDAASPAKRALVEQLQKRYANIQQLNAVWSTQFADRPALLDKPFKPPAGLSVRMREDLSAFVETFAEQYFRIIRDALKKYDPNHLYLGARFFDYTEEGVQACAEFCDILSFNIYNARVDEDRWSFLKDLGKPMIGDSTLGALDRGMFHAGLVATRDQKARAEISSTMCAASWTIPHSSDAHYFKYADQPLTGRPGDGENFSIGFTTVVDGLYPEMIEAAKTVSEEMYSRRSRP